MTGTPQSVVIVGGGVAGVSAAGALRAGGFDGEVTLIDSGPFPYDRPPLSKGYLEGKRELKQIALQSPQWYIDQAVRLLAGATVSRLRADLGQVELDGGGLLRADRVVLAIGGKAIRPSIPGADSESVHVLRTVEDADRLRSALVPGARIVIVGAGLIGAEVAATASGLGCQVVLIDPVATPLVGAVSPELAHWLHGLHRRNGVNTVRGAVTEIVTGADGPTVVLTNGSEHPADAVLLAVGMAADTLLAQDAKLRCRRGVLVDNRQLTSNSAVLAIGDAAVRSTTTHRSGHWEAAQLDGAAAAATILGVRSPVDSASWFWTDRYGLHVEGVGLFGSFDQIVVRGVLGTPPFSVFAVSEGKLKGAAAVDDSTSVRAARKIIDRKLVVDSEDLANPKVSLRTLLRG